MKQRVITVPKDKYAEKSLDYDEANENQLIDFHLTDTDFKLLWDNGLFTLINDAGNSNIDDYEDDSVKGVINIENVINALKVKQVSIAGELVSSVEKIRNLFEEALERGTGVYFYF